MQTRPMVFGIGLNKTGTRSLHEALQVLGYRSLHWGGPATVKAVERALAEGRPLLEDLPGYDAFSDILPLSVNYALLDRQHPGSRFVLTVRELDGWLDSRRRHVEQNVADKAAGTYTGPFLEVDIAAWTAERERHHAAVLEYFADRPADLLVIDISQGQGYELLCPFLGLAPPATPFPWRTHASPA